MRRDVGIGREGLLPGAVLAGATAVVSGVSVFVNGSGVRALPNPALYTTAKNLVAAALLGVAAVAIPAWRGAPAAARARPTSRLGRAARAAGLAYVAAIGGGVAFVLFFTGLARTSAEPAAFVHDTIVIFVGALAWIALRERVAAWNLVAMVALVGGQALVSGGIGRVTGAGGLMLVLAATLLWAVEVVVVKRLLSYVSPGRLALLRMGGGSVLLVGYLGVDHELGALAALSGREVAWVLATGALLACYVGTWFTALARGRAVDVTSVLAGGVVVTAALEAITGHPGLAPEPVGLGLVIAGAATVYWRWPRGSVA
ncbi:MAG TPA: EamA family transporter [Acidimicrobiales bacterium]|nr:EamA family transporter [Acidimicrobiales bacterium]